MIRVNNLDIVANKIKRFPYKFKREINRIPAIQVRKEKAYQELLNRHYQFLPKLNAEDKAIINSLNE